MGVKSVHQVRIQGGHPVAKLELLFFVLMFLPEDAENRDEGHCKGTNAQSLYDHHCDPMMCRIEAELSSTKPP